MSSITATSPEITSQLYVEKPPEQNTPRWRTIGKIALKVLCAISIGVGIAAAIAGALFVTKLSVATGIIIPLIVPCVAAAGYITYFSVMLMKNHVTALGAVVTLPMAALCLAPVMSPAAIGAIPGGALIGLGAWGWSALS